MCAPNLPFRPRRSAVSITAAPVCARRPTMTVRLSSSYTQRIHFRYAFDRMHVSMTRATAALLGPCFKTGPTGGYHKDATDSLMGTNFQQPQVRRDATTQIINHTVKHEMTTGQNDRHHSAYCTPATAMRTNCRAAMRRQTTSLQSIKRCRQ